MNFTQSRQAIEYSADPYGLKTVAAEKTPLVRKPEFSNLLLNRNYFINIKPRTL